MTQPVIYVDIGLPIEECSRVLEAYGVRRVLVHDPLRCTDEDPLAAFVGVVSDADLFKCMGAPALSPGACSVGGACDRTRGRLRLLQRFLPCINSKAAHAPFPVFRATPLRSGGLHGQLHGAVPGRPAASHAVAAAPGRTRRGGGALAGQRLRDRPAGGAGDHVLRQLGLRQCLRQRLRRALARALLGVGSQHRGLHSAGAEDGGDGVGAVGHDCGAVGRGPQLQQYGAAERRVQSSGPVPLRGGAVGA